MPESDTGERTEQATPRRRQDAREKGQVAKSTDLTVAISLLGAVVLLHLGGRTLLTALALVTRKRLDSMADGALSAQSLRLIYGQGIGAILSAAAPIFFGMVVVTLAGTLVQTGIIWTSEPLKLDLSRLDPVSGLGKIVSKKGFVRLLSSIFKVVVIGVIAWVTISSKLAFTAGTIDLSPSEIVTFGSKLVLTLGYRVAAALLVIALIDYGFQRWQHEQDLMMTRQELKDELKRMEGDPLTRERRRRMQRQIVAQRMMHEVPNADVVITNPTELAIAIRYDADETTAPLCVAKGTGHMAARIRKVAAENGVPIVENKPVARLLYRRVEVGGEVPVELYQAVAEILAHVYRIKGKTLPEVAA